MGSASFILTPRERQSLAEKEAGAIDTPYEAPLRPVIVPESAADVKRMLAETMADIRAERMDPKLGSTIGYLGMALLRAFEVAEFEQRLERLEQKNELEEQAEQTGTSEARDSH